VRRRDETQRALRVGVALVGDVQVEEIDSSCVLLLEPVHDGRHGLAPQSARVEELHQLRTAGARKLRDVALASCATSLSWYHTLSDWRLPLAQRGVSVRRARMAMDAMATTARATKSDAERFIVGNLPWTERDRSDPRFQ
jgi:hypothetical protein